MRKTRPENPIVTRSRAALTGAATRLLEGRAASAISVKDVVEEAGMSRPTFYQHFPDLGSLFAAAGLARLEETFAGIGSIGGIGSFGGIEAPGGSEDALAGVFGVVIERMAEHATFYARIHESQGGAAFHAGVVAATAAWLRQEPLLRNLADRDEAFWEFLAAGVVWIVTRHLAALCVDPLDASHPDADLARILASIVRADAALR